MPSESKLEKKIVEHAKELGMLTFKFSSPSQRGVPDRIFLHNGHVLLLEIKAPGKVPNEQQFAVMRVLRMHSIPCAWTDSLDNAEDILHDFKVMPNSFNHTHPL